MKSISTASAVPFDPRMLTRTELLRLDVYMFDSPKNRRRVTVIRPAALAKALELEFTPEVPAYVERPRHLEVDKVRQELSFWWTTGRGLEQFCLLTAHPEGISGKARAAERRKEAIVAAGRDAQIALQLLPEASFLRQATQNANRMRLLPYVQTARQLASIDDVKARVLEIFEFQPRLSFFRVEQAINNLDPRSVRAATCDLIHEGKLALDLGTKLHLHTVVSKGALP